MTVKTGVKKTKSEQYNVTLIPIAYAKLKKIGLRKFDDLLDNQSYETYSGDEVHVYQATTPVSF